MYGNADLNNSFILDQPDFLRSCGDFVHMGHMIMHLFIDFLWVLGCKQNLGYIWLEIYIAYQILRCLLLLTFSIWT